MNFVNKPKYQELTFAQLKALEEYSIEHGRNWKACLRNDWENGRAYGELQQIRNIFGPTWLIRFRFPLGGSRYFAARKKEAGAA